ncbi:MAG: hypothetical protein RLZZ142_413 [Verrucomicrobiota bacterium]
MSGRGAGLGVGVGFRPEWLGELMLQRGEVDFLEVTIEHFVGGVPERQGELDLLGRHFPLIPHGLNLSLGSAEGVDEGHLERVAEVVQRVGPWWWSEHVAWTRAGGVEMGHLSPLPWTGEALRVLVRNIRRVGERIPFPLILENITANWVLPGAEMSEPEFLRRLVEETGCGLLLDITNLHINACNHGFDARRFVDALPLERVVQLHFVGCEERDGRLHDAHATDMSPPLWELLDHVLAAAPVRGAILERDERIPPLGEVLGDLRRAREMGRKYGRWS